MAPILRSSARLTAPLNSFGGFQVPHHTGWLRLGIVFSGLWVVALGSYAAFEFYTFPRWALNTPEITAESKQFFFVGAMQAPWREREPQAAELARGWVKDAKTEEERKFNENLLNSTEHYAGLLPTFYLALIAGLAAFWALAFGGTFLLKWVRAGFREHEASQETDPK